MGSGGGITTIADHSTPVPGPQESFIFNHGPTISDGGVVFMSIHDGIGIYLATSEGIELVADGNTPHPGGVGNLWLNNVAPTISGDVVTFACAFGLYQSVDGEIEQALERNEDAPGGGEIISFEKQISSDGGDLAVRGSMSPNGGPVENGVWRVADGIREPISVLGDLLPPNFTSSVVYTGVPAIGPGSFAFTAGDWETEGLYLERASGLTRIVSRGDAMPGVADSFYTFYNLSVDGERVAFEGHGELFTSGIYAWHEGQLVEVIASGDALDGKTIAFASISHDAVSGDKVAFHVQFLGPSQGIYVATLGSPVAVPGLPPAFGWALAVALGLAGTRRLAAPTSPWLNRSSTEPTRPGRR